MAIVGAGVSGCRFVAWSFFLAGKYRTNGNTDPKKLGVMMVMLLTLLPVPFIFQLGGLESGLLSLVPVCAFAANAFANPRRMGLPNLLFILAVAVIAINNWQLLKN